MPDWSEFPEDPGADVFAQPRARTATIRDAGPKVDTRAAVDAVIKLMGPGPTQHRPQAQAPKATHMLPSARVRAALERLVQYGTVEELDRHSPDMKALAADLFDWSPDQKSTKATKSVAKALGTLLLARDANGVSRYPHAVEMVSFAAAAAPLLEPDRLLRLLASAENVETAFAPQRYTMQLASALKTVFGRYPDQRREQLLISLWQQSHAGRWWDITSGIVTVRTGLARRRRDPDEEAQERREAAEAQLRTLLAGEAENTAEGRDLLVSAMLEGQVPFSDTAARLVGDLPETPELRAKLVGFAEIMNGGESVDPDIAVLASHIGWLRPAERPETPVTWLVKTLIRVITPDPETGVVALESLPDKPKEFRELFPQVSLSGFPFPNAIQSLHHKRLDGVQGEPVVIELVHNAAELAENRDYMGNCTWSYKAQMEAGTYALLKLWRGDSCYNAALLYNGGGWRPGEINSRFNAGGVPDDIRAATATLAARLPAMPVTVADREKHDLRNIKYRIV